MSKREINIPTNIEELMQIYADYENSKKRKGHFSTPDILQNSAYKSNPMTPFHKEYYSSKYRSVHYWLMLSCLIVSIIFFVVSFIGFLVVPNSEGFITTYFIALAYSILVSVLIPRIFLNRWNWKYPSILIPLSIGILFGIVSIYNFITESPEIDIILYTLCGISLGPAFLMIYLSYRNYSYITDYGGVHLHLGWMYRIAQTKGNLKILTTSITRFVEDLEMWLITTSKVTLKNKQRILEAFFLKIISDRNSIGEITQSFKDDFNDIFKGLLVEDLLHSEVFSHVNEKDKRIPKLNRSDLEYLRYRLALTQLPGIIELIENLTSTKARIRIYSTIDKIKKIWSNFLAAIIFLVSSLIPLILYILNIF